MAKTIWKSTKITISEISQISLTISRLTYTCELSQISLTILKFYSLVSYPFMNFDMESVAYQRIKFAAKIPSTSKSMVKTFT